MSVLSPIAPKQPAKSALPSLLTLMGLVAVLYLGRAFFITLVISIILAFMLDPFVNLAMKLKLPRGLASFVVCSLGLLMLYLFGVGTYTQMSGLVDELPAYAERIGHLIDQVTLRVEEMEKAVSEVIVPKRIQERDKPPPPPPPKTKTKRTRTPEPEGPPPIQEVRILQEPTPVLGHIYGYLSSFYNVLLMASFVPFLVYFMLSWRDHIRRSYLQLFPGPNRIVASKTWEGIASMARAYVVGNFILGMLLTAASALFFWLVNLPYPLVIGPLSGFLSLVPYIGLPLSIIPPLFAALRVYTSLTPYFIIGTTVAFFHLLALNLLYPKFVGSRVQLNPLAVTLALMFWGTIWGGIGLLLGIPITAAVKAVCDNVESLHPYARLLGD